MRFLLRNVNVNALLALFLLQNGVEYCISVRFGSDLFSFFSSSSSSSNQQRTTIKKNDMLLFRHPRTSVNAPY